VRVNCLQGNTTPGQQSKHMPEQYAPDDNNAQSCLQAAMTCHQQGQLYDADLYYSRTLQLDPENIQALRLRAILAREQGAIERALLLLDRAVELAPKHSLPLSDRGITHMMTGALQSAETDLRAALTLAPNSVDVLTNLGALLQHRGHLAEAIALYREILALDSDEIEIHCNLAKALADAGQEAAALNEIDTAIAAANGGRGTLATRGAILLDAKRYDDARETLEQASRANEQDDMTLVNLALCCTESGNIKAATKALQHALEINPDNARAAADRVNCLSAQGLNKNALQLAEDFLREHPAERLVTASYAQALLNAGHKNAAAELLDSEKFILTFDLPVPENFEHHNAFNTALREQLLADPSLIRDPVSKATTGGEQTGELNLQSSPAYAAFSELADTAIAQAAAEYSERGLDDHPVMQPASDNWNLRTWGTVLHAGGIQSAHMHPLGWLSAVYYVSVPADMNTNNDTAGWLEFGIPPERVFTRTDSTPASLEPRVGRLIVFPSWFWHRTRPFVSNQARISIAFDVMPKNRLSAI
jgi:uncharacterized protein (TIGR02466 family)